jgi:hypothetical protein
MEVTQPQEAGGLQVFGLRWDHPDGLTYRTLDEALAARELHVTEISTGGSVPLLKAVNRSDGMVLLMAGEQLIGAKQNRVLNTSLMLAGRSELPIPVSCVEAGRWGYRSSKFDSAGTMSHGALRKLMARHISESYSREGRPASDQGAVWREVARKLTALDAFSPSQALQQTYEDYQNRLAALLAQLPVPPACSGVAFALGGRIAGADLFEKPTTLAKLWPKLVRAYALDALELGAVPAPPVRAEQVQQWLRSAAQGQAQSFKSPGLGSHVRLRGPRVVGACLLVDDQPVHLEVFAQEEAAV